MCIYRSSVFDSDNFVNTLRKVINETETNSAWIIFTGDMNVNIVCVQENNNKYLNLLSESGFKSFIITPDCLKNLIMWV